MSHNSKYYVNIFLIMTAERSKKLKAFLFKKIGSNSKDKETDHHGHEKNPNWPKLRHITFYCT